MKILQLNTWGLRLADAIAKTFNNEQPDIVCLQEVCTRFDKEVISTTFIGTVEYLQAQSTYLEYSYVSPTLDFTFMHSEVGFGNAVLSRWPIVSQTTLQTGGDYRSNFDHAKHSANVRNLQHTVIDTPEGELHVLNHHGHWVGEHKNGNEETMRQMEIINNYIAGLQGPKILCGDFNLAPDSDSLNKLNQSLRNLSIEAKLTTTRNQFTSKKEVCDYIFISNDITLKSFNKLEDLISDHAALTAEISLK